MQIDIDLMQILCVPNKGNGQTYKGTSHALHMGKLVAKRAIYEGKDLIGCIPKLFATREPVITGKFLRCVWQVERYSVCNGTVQYP